MLVLIASAAAAYMTAEHWLPEMARFLDVGEPPIKADYALVLGGDEQSRPFGAAALYKAGYVRKVLLTRPSDRFLVPADEGDVNRTTKAILKARGVPDVDVIELDRVVESTYDEALALEPILQREPQAVVVVVTSTYHARRSLWAFQHAWPAAAERLHLFAVPTDGFAPDDWWQTEAGLTTYLREYARLAFYHFRYGRGVMVAAIAVVVIVALSLWSRHRRTRRASQS